MGRILRALCRWRSLRPTFVELQHLLGGGAYWMQHALGCISGLKEHAALLGWQSPRKRYVNNPCWAPACQVQGGRDSKQLINPTRDPLPTCLKRQRHSSVLGLTLGCLPETLPFVMRCGGVCNASVVPCAVSGKPSREGRRNKPKEVSYENYNGRG